MIFQIIVRINLLMALLEAIFLILLLILSFYIIYRLIPREFRINEKIFSRSMRISSIICFGILFGIKMLFQILAFIHQQIITALSKDIFLFGIGVLLFALFYKLFATRNNRKLSKAFKKWIRIFVILCLAL